MKTYKILSITFIVICAALLIGLFTVHGYSAGNKIIFAVCLCVVIALMALNLVVMNKRGKKE